MAQFSGFSMNLSGLIGGLNEHEQKFKAATLMYAATEAANLEKDMKENRKWTDRTGDAKKRLKGRAYAMPKGVRIELSHGVEYGLWLEMAMEKRYAIIAPTIRIAGPFVLEGFRDLFSKMK